MHYFILFCGWVIFHYIYYVLCILHIIYVMLLLLFSCSVMSNSLRPHGLQHARLPCLSQSPRACSNSLPLSWWCHPTISSSVSPFTSCPQSFPASGSFLVSHLFTSCGQNIGASALVQGWFPLGLTDLNSMQPKGLSRVFFNITVQKHQFLWSNSHIHTWLLKKKHSFDYMNLCWQSNVSAF